MRLRPATAAVLAQTGLTAGMPDGQLEQFLADLVGRAPTAQGLDRRTFLQILGLGTAGVAAALWVPGQKTILLPPERSVVTATPADVQALRACFAGPFMTHCHTPVTFGRLDPAQALRWLSDQEYALVLDRGRKILASRRRRR
jgi:hypothetical protein